MADDDVAVEMRLKSPTGDDDDDEYDNGSVPNETGNALQMLGVISMREKKIERTLLGPTPTTDCTNCFQLGTVYLRCPRAGVIYSLLI